MDELFIEKELDLNQVLDFLKEQISEQNINVFANSLRYLSAVGTQSLPIINHFETPYSESTKKLAGMYLEVGFLTTDRLEQFASISTAVALNPSIELKRSYSLGNIAQLYETEDEIGISGVDISYYRTDDDMLYLESLLSRVKDVYIKTKDLV